MPAISTDGEDAPPRVHACLDLLDSDKEILRTLYSPGFDPSSPVPGDPNRREPALGLNTRLGRAVIEY